MSERTLRIRDLERKTRIRIVKMSLADTSVGIRICVQTECFQFYLPEAWTNRFTEEQMAEFSEFVYKGKAKMSDGQIKLNMDFS